LRSRVLYLPAHGPLPQEERGCRDQASENNIQLNFTTRQEAIDALEKHLPSHLVKRARERGAINSERSEHLNSILKTAVGDVWL
jgi:hypothetical protein